MENLLILTILNSLIIVGLYKSFQYEYKYITHKDKPTPDDIDSRTKGIFWWWKWTILEAEWMPYRLSKPLGNCMICMASIYSFVPYWWFNCWNFATFETWIFYPVYILMVAGLNAVMDSMVNE